MTYRVVQWNTGNVGKTAVPELLAHPELELVGCYAWSKDKAGKDVGELVGIDPVGVTATNDVDELLALKPDCVMYTPMFADIDEMVRILEAGVNISNTALFVTGHSFGEEARNRVLAACEKGGASVFGSGVNPTWIEQVMIALANGCERIDKISVTETADITGYDSPATELPVGFGRPVDDPALPGMTRDGTKVFEEAVRVLGYALGVEFDEVRCDAEYAQTTQDLDLGSWTIKAGCVAGVSARWKGILDGREIVELRILWRKGQTLEPDWAIESGYKIQIDGWPTYKVSVENTSFSEVAAGGLDLAAMQKIMTVAMVATSQPAVNAIPKVVEAAPGIVTYADWLPRAMGAVRR